MTRFRTPFYDPFYAVLALFWPGPGPGLVLAWSGPGPGLALALARSDIGLGPMFYRKLTEMAPFCSEMAPFLSKWRHF